MGVEKFLALLLLAPFRCRDCDKRYLGWAWARTVYLPHDDDSNPLGFHTDIPENFTLDKSA